MSHHYSGPNIGFPRGDARLDLTDLYAFPKPGVTIRSEPRRSRTTGAGSATTFLMSSSRSSPTGR